MDDKELIEWLRTSGSDLDPCLDAADTIERLQRELAESRNKLPRDVTVHATTFRAGVSFDTLQTGINRHVQYMTRAIECAEKAERERDEARAERDAFWDALTEAEAVLRNDLYKNRVANALAIIDEARHIDRDSLHAALGGEGLWN